MTYKTATPQDLRDVARKLLSEELTGFRCEIVAMSAEIIVLRNALKESDAEHAVQLERLRVDNLRAKAAIQRLNRALNEVTNRV